MNRYICMPRRAALLFVFVMLVSITAFAADETIPSETVEQQDEAVLLMSEEELLSKGSLVSEDEPTAAETPTLQSASEPAAMSLLAWDDDEDAGTMDVEAELYLKTDDADLGDGTYFGVQGEPENGFVVGAYAEMDELVHDPYGTERYWNEYPAVTGVDTGVYLLYMDYWMPLSRYRTHVEAAQENGFAIELSLQPRTGLDAVHADDLALMQLARDVEASGVQFYIRFAAEMNDTSGGNPWYTTDTEEYIRAFRAVADVFHEYAPSAAMVWSPNYLPSDNITDYYPGDEYVDIVGVSLYLPYRAENEDSLRWIEQLETIYELYGDSKPIMISEGAVCFSTADGQDLSDYAAAQVRDLFVYLPIRFPNVKFMVWFDAEDTVGNEVYSCLTSNPTVLNAYRETLLASESVLFSVDDPAAPVYYERLYNRSVVDDGEVTLCSYLRGGMSVASVNYSVNGKVIGTSSEAPFEITVDLSDYRGRYVDLTVSCYGEYGDLVGSDTTILRVAGVVSDPAYTDATANGEKDDTAEETAANGTTANETVTNETAANGATANGATANGAATKQGEEETLLVEEVVVENGFEDARTLQVELQGKFVTLSPDGVAYARTLQVELDGKSVALPAYAVKDAKGYETNYVSLSDVASVFNGSAAEFHTDLENTAASDVEERAYRETRVTLLIDGEPTTLTSIVLEDGSIYFMLRELGQAVGFNVNWSVERGIFINTQF